MHDRWPQWLRHKDHADKIFASQEAVPPGWFTADGDEINPAPKPVEVKPNGEQQAELPPDNGGGCNPLDDGPSEDRSGAGSNGGHDSVADGAESRGRGGPDKKRRDRKRKPGDVYRELE